MMNLQALATSFHQDEDLVCTELVGGDFPSGGLVGVAPPGNLELAMTGVADPVQALAQFGIHAHQHGEIVGLQFEVRLELCAGRSNRYGKGD
jgi:hypothetical protein